MENRIFPVTILSESLQDVITNEKTLMNTPCTSSLGQRIHADFGIENIIVKLYNPNNPNANLETFDNEVLNNYELKEAIEKTNNDLANIVKKTSSEKSIEIPLKYNSIESIQKGLENTVSYNSDGFSFEACSAIDTFFGNNTLPPILLAEEEPKVFFGQSNFENNEYSSFRRYIPDTFTEYYTSIVQGICNTIVKLDNKLKDYIRDTLKLTPAENFTLKNISDMLFGKDGYSNKGISYYLEEISNQQTSSFVKSYEVTLCVPKLEYTHKTFKEGEEPDLETWNNLSELTIVGYNYILISERIDTLPLDAIQTELDREVNNIKKALEGSINTNSNSLLLCTPEKNNCDYDKKSDSLYVKRYMMLNKRLNKINGPLYTAKRNLDEIKYLDSTVEQGESLVNTYKNDLETLKVLKSTPLVYINSSEVPNTIPQGKFITQEVYDKLKSQIGEHCYLTCGPCSIRSTCPFHDQDAYLKTVCPSTNHIELWFKDNKIDLIDATSVSLQAESSSDSEFLDISSMLEAIKNPYKVIDLVSEDSYEEAVSKGNVSNTEVDSTVLNKKDNILQKKTIKLEEALSSERNLQFSPERDSLDWLNGGYFGTIQKSNNNCFNPDSDINITLPGGYQNIEFPDYTFLYDTIFLEDTETEFDYKETGNIPYDNITLELDGTLYKGTAAIKKATSLKLFKQDNVNNFDEVYLISEDDTSSIKIPYYEGNKKLFEVTPPPLVCLGRIGDLAIDCNDFSHLAQQQEVIYSSDIGNKVSVKMSSKNKEDMGRNLVQWNINMLKGNSMYNPVNPDTHSGQDQFWMKTIYQKNTKNGDTNLFDVYSGRDRFTSENIGELAIDPQHPDLGRILLGKPFIISKENFGRKCIIKIADENQNQLNDIKWSIPWISPRHIKQEFSLLGIDGLTDDIINKIRFLQETRRVVLTQMKTNLRLVVVHYSKDLDNYMSYFKFDEL